MRHIDDCPMCFGTGCKHIHETMIDEPCENCAGEGTNPSFRTNKLVGESARILRDPIAVSQLAEALGMDRALLDAALGEVARANLRPAQ